MKKLLTIRIVGADFSETDYRNCNDCAITRALKRAGYSKLRDCGVNIDGKGKSHWENVRLPVETDNYDALADKVINSYRKAKKGAKIRDFSYTLRFTEKFDLTPFK